MKKLIGFITLWVGLVALGIYSTAHGQGSTLPFNPGNSFPSSPISFGTSVVPTYATGIGGLNGTFTAASTTFTCNSGCSSIAIGSWLNGQDSSAQQIWPAQAGELGVIVTSFSTGSTCTNGCTVTTQIASNAALVPGSYTFQVGLTRWSATSSILANTIGFNNLWGGAAALGNQTWMVQYLQGDCDSPTAATVCILGIPGNRRNVTVGSRTSDNAIYGIEVVGINDNVGTPFSFWSNYWQTELMPGAGTAKGTRSLESTTFNFNSTVARADPFQINPGSAIENLRLTSGQPGQLYQMYPASDYMSFAAITPDVGTGGAYSGLVFANGALDTTSLTHPPVLSLPSGANGYSLTWYKAQGYTVPAWQIYATDTGNNGNYLDLSDNAATFGVHTGIGTPTVAVTPGGIAVAGNYTAVTTFGTTAGTGLNVAAQTIQDNIIANGGTVVQTYVHHIGRPTLTTTGTGVNLTTADTLAIDNCPAAGTNVTITNCFAVRVIAGTTRLDGGLTVNGALTSGSGTIILNNAATADTTAIGTGSNTGNITIGNASGGSQQLVISTPSMKFGSSLYESNTAPTINSHFNTSADTVTAVSTAAFRVTVGTGTATNTGSLTFPAATTGWSCKVTDATTNASFIVEAFSTSTTAVTVNNYSRTTGTATNFTNSEKLDFLCGAF